MRGAGKIVAIKCYHKHFPTIITLSIYTGNVN